VWDIFSKLGIVNRPWQVRTSKGVQYLKGMIRSQIMQKREGFLIALISGLVAFSPSTIFAPTLTETQAGINATVTKEDLEDKTIKLVVSSRTKQLDALPISMPAGDVQCQ
jgi:hypothetical protein